VPSNTLTPFNIVHSNLRTSPLSTSKHKYYIFLLDDYSNFLWTFLGSKKLQVYSTFSFSDFIKTHFDKNINFFECDNKKDFYSIFRRWSYFLFFIFHAPYFSKKIEKLNEKCELSRI